MENKPNLNKISPGRAKTLYCNKPIPFGQREVKEPGTLTRAELFKIKLFIMKKLQNLGRSLSKEEQKKIVGGNPEWIVNCHTSAGIIGCYEHLYLCEAYCISDLTYKCRVVENSESCS